MITYPLGDLPCSCQDQFWGSAAGQKTVRGTVFPPNGTGDHHADPSS